MADGLQRLSEEEIEQLNAPQPVPRSGRTHAERSKSVDKKKQQIKNLGLEAMRVSSGPAGRIMNWLFTPEQINVDPMAPDNRYTADVLANRALLKALSGESSQDVRAKAEQDKIHRAGLAGIDTSEGPGSAARGMGAVTDAQSRVTKASVQQILSDASLMEDILRGVHGAEEQYKWFRALSEAARLGTISQVNLGLLNDAKNRMAAMGSVIGVEGAKQYSAWKRYQQGQKDKNELARLNALDRRDQAAGIGTSSGPGTLGSGNWTFKMSWWEDTKEWLSDTGDALGELMFQGDWSSSRPPRDPIAENQMPREDPAIQSDINRLRGIASGAIKDPGVQMLEDQARRSGQQAYGLAQGLGMQNAATRQRLAQGGRGAALRELPEMREAATIDAKQAAAAKLTEALEQRRALEEEKIQERKKQELQKEIDRAAAVEKNKESILSFASSFLPFALGAGADASDEKLKENIAPAGRDTRQFIDSLEPKRFNYKGADPYSPQLGVLANDIDRGPVVNMGTREDPVLGLDQQKTRSALLASVGKLGQENRQLATALTDLDRRLKSLTGEDAGTSQAQRGVRPGPSSDDDRAHKEIMKAQENEALKSIGQRILDEKRRKGY